MRPLAIELTFDAESDERLRRAWHRIGALCERSTAFELGLHPHVTLALFRSDEPTDLGEVVAALAAEVTAFDLHLATVGHFLPAEGVVYLRPDPSFELRRAHALLDDLLGPQRALVDAYYRLDVWQPHCTMAIDVQPESLEAVAAACDANDVRGSVRVQDVRLTRYRPASELRRAALATG